MVAAEHAVLHAYRRGQGLTCGVVHPVVTEQAITTWQMATGHSLGGDQAGMVRSITTSGDRVQCVIGPAGTSKTAALNIAARAWETAGYRVIGATVNGTAAEVLARSTNIDTNTVAYLLTRLDTAPQPLIDERTVIVIDEASTLGNRALARLVRHTETAGATLRLVGDPAQHGAVEAGGLFAHLARNNPNRTPTLTVDRRQTAGHMADVRHATTDYRAGRIAQALNRLDTNDRIVTASTAAELLDTLAADWYDDRTRHHANPERTAASHMVAEHHHERRALNRRAQALLLADDTLTGPGIDIADSTFHIGDHVITHEQHRGLRPAAGDRGSYLRNGTRGVVINITAADTETPGLVVDFENRVPGPTESGPRRR